MQGDAETITTYLEMRAPQVAQTTPPHRSGMLLRVGESDPSFYRYLRGQLGEAWAGERAAVVALLDDIDYDVYVLFMSGVPSAMFELDRRNPAEIELVGFGVLDGYEGRGLAKFVLATAVEAAWGHGPERVWVRSINRDDPRRILLLQWAGFVPYETTRERPA